MKVTFKTMHTTVEADICGQSETSAIDFGKLDLASRKSVEQ